MTHYNSKLLTLLNSVFIVVLLFEGATLSAGTSPTPLVLTDVPETIYQLLEKGAKWLCGRYHAHNTTLQILVV